VAAAGIARASNDPEAPGKPRLPASSAALVSRRPQDLGGRIFDVHATAGALLLLPFGRVGKKA